MFLAIDAQHELPDPIANIADNFQLGEIHWVDGSRREIDMNDFKTVGVHKEWRLLNDVVSDIGTPTSSEAVSLNDAVSIERAMSKSVDPASCGPSTSPHDAP